MVGLEQFLFKRTWLYNRGCGIVVEKNGEVMNSIKKERVRYVAEHVGYWTNAWAIHDYFIKMHAPSEDMNDFKCSKTYHVSMEDLQGLFELCRTVKTRIADKVYLKQVLPHRHENYDEEYECAIDQTLEVLEMVIKEDMKQPQEYYYDFKLVRYEWHMRQGAHFPICSKYWREMGLDQFLYKKTWVGGDEYDVVVTGVENSTDERIKYVVEEIGYWRNAWPIHQKIMEIHGSLDYKDVCRDGYKLSIQDFQTLKKVCNAAYVGETSKMPWPHPVYVEKYGYCGKYYDDVSHTHDVLTSVFEEHTDGSSYYYTFSY